MAEQLALLPPLLPLQDQVQGPEPPTVDAVPLAQRFDVGFDATVVPFAEPQEPCTIAWQLLAVSYQPPQDAAGQV